MPPSAISDYPDVNEIYRKLDELFAQPIRPIAREPMRVYLAWFEQRCGKSKQMIDVAKEFCPNASRRARWARA